MKWPASLLLCAACLSSCKVGPDYSRPPANVPAAFRESPPAGWIVATPRDSADKGAWWSVYDDKLLDSLERRVAIGNQTLAADAAAFRNAEALVDEARASLYPSLTGSPTVTRSSSGGSSSGSSSAATGTTTTTTSGTTIGSTGGSGRTTRTQYSLEGSASWEIDVWGRIRRQVDSNVALAQASAADLANARLSAQALLATDYLDLRVSDALRRVLDETVQNDARALQITKNQYDAGFAARSDVLLAQTQLDTARSAAVNVGVARAQYEHAIAVLMGVPPAQLVISAVRAVPAVPVTPPSVPAVLLQRRPDIASAERTIASENALIGVAVAAYYPTVTLSALFGFAGDPIGSLISSSSRLWSLGAAASETLFEGGTRTAAVTAARAAYDQSVATYRETVLTAFQQVEDDLSSLRILQQQAVIQDEAVADAQRSAVISLNEYRAGTQAYTAVITAQNTLLSAQQTVLSIEQNRLAASVALVQALGGGWSLADLPARHDLKHNEPLLPW